MNNDRDTARNERMRGNPTDQPNDNGIMRGNQTMTRSRTQTGEISNDELAGDETVSRDETHRGGMTRGQTTRSETGAGE